MASPIEDVTRLGLALVRHFSGGLWKYKVVQAGQLTSTHSASQEGVPEIFFRRVLRIGPELKVADGLFGPVPFCASRLACTSSKAVISPA